MTLEEIQQALHDIATVRMPTFPDDLPPKEKIEALEDHLLETARHRQTLCQAQLILEDSFEAIDEEWLSLEGWEVNLRGKPKSQGDIDEAKRVANSDLFFSRRRCLKLMRQVKNQITRMEKDDAAASRAYTMLTGS